MVNQAVETSLFQAIRAGDITGVKQAIQAGVEIDAPNNMGWTNLIWAVEFPTESTATIVALLLQAGADVNVQDAFGHTPLMYAVIYSDQQIVQQLLQAGADVDTVDHSGESVLFHAVNSENPAALKTIVKLLQAGATVPVNLREHATVVAAQKLITASI